MVRTNLCTTGDLKILSVDQFLLFSFIFRVTQREKSKLANMGTNKLLLDVSSIVITTKNSTMITFSHYSAIKVFLVCPLAIPGSFALIVRKCGGLATCKSFILKQFKKFSCISYFSRVSVGSVSFRRFRDFGILLPWYACLL